MAAESEFDLVLNNRGLVDLRQGVFNFDDGQAEPARATSPWPTGPCCACTATT